MNESFGLSAKTLDLLKSAFERFPEIEEARVFGSRALGNYKKGSDIDLAILGRRVNETTVRRISLLLNQELPIPYHVDVVCYELCENEALRSHIAAYGRKFEP